MTRDDIVRMAREAGLDPDLWNYTDAFERFAALVAATEREACAQVCESYDDDSGAGEAWASRFAQVIRARGKR